MNKAVLCGRLARDPELRTTQAGKQVATFTVAVDRAGKKGEADFIPCIAWEKSAEFVSKYFNKGKQILLEGRIQVRQYEDKQGQKRYATEVIVEHVEFVGSKNDNAGQGYGETNKSYGGSNGGGYQQTSFGDGFGKNNNADDIPF